VRVGKRWLPLNEAQQLAAQDPRLLQYRQMRAALEKRFVGPVEHTALARWCRQQGLDAQAKYHWYKVLQAEPQHAEALQGLGVVWYGGTLMAKEELARLHKDARRARYALNEWGRRLDRLARKIEHSKSRPEQAAAALRELRAVDDPEAVAALEKILAEGNPTLAREVVQVLGNIAVQQATQALVRISVLAPDRALRAAAAEQLRVRPLHDYAPLLLAGLENPLETWFQVSLTPAGHVTYRHELYREGAASDSVLKSTQSFIQFDIPGASVVVRSVIYGDAVIESSPAEEMRKNLVKKNQAARAAGQFGTTAASLERQVARANERSELINSRIQFVLQHTTGQDLGSQPQNWWDWWKDYNDVFSTGEKPVYERYLTGYTETSLIPEVWMSCFPQGTPIWTQAGLAAIEKVRPGDLVLSQDVESGELTYKPVLKTTLRPPCGILRLQIGDEMISVTRGHPFWVTGSGWRMAKLLKEGQLLHGLQGSLPIRRIEATGEAEAYNLVVGGLNTYFVGTTGVLVHDNTYRRPTTALLPGLQRDCRADIPVAE
jgi:hypothetical protein